MRVGTLGKSSLPFQNLQRSLVKKTTAGATCNNNDLREASFVAPPNPRRLKEKRIMDPPPKWHAFSKGRGRGMIKWTVKGF
jgi:hypothetical protein